jgi:hypothetical protein
MNGAKHELAAGVKESFQGRIGNVTDGCGWNTPLACRSTLPERAAQALRRMPETMSGVPPLPLPQNSPLNLDELLSGE